MNKWVLILIFIMSTTSRHILADTLLKSPDSEVTDAITFLQNCENNKVYPRAEDHCYIKFFTTYAIPEEYRRDAVLTTSFLMASLTGPTNDKEGNAGSYYPLARMEETKKGERIFVPYTQVSPTLWYYDTRNYNWTPQAIEDVSSLDGYFVEPVVNHVKNGLLRLMSGNAILRMDWFIFHASDLAQQDDRGEQVKIYRRLLYAQSKEPKTVKELANVWQVPISESYEFATLVTKSRQVARHNRLLFGQRTLSGWWYETFDVKAQQGYKDFVESFPIFQGKKPPSDAYDAGEIITTNALQLQVYDLADNKEKLLDFADPAVVRHTGDILGDARVRVGHSCFDCHAGGLIPSENTIKEFIESSGKFAVPYKEDQLRYDRKFLSERFEESVEENRAIFARALKKTNGLTPEENVKAYLKLVQWYNKDLDIKQAAIECGVTEKIFIEKMKDGKPLIGNGRVPGRIALLLKTEENIPRDVWETRGRNGIPGTFEQAMVILHGLTSITKEKVYEYTKDEIRESRPEEIERLEFEIIKPTQAKRGNEIIAELKKGDKVKGTGKTQRVGRVDWIGIEVAGELGWVQTNFLREVK